MSLVLRPLLVAPAKAYVMKAHRRLPRLAGAMWAVGVFDGAELVGCAAVGRPNARLKDRVGELQVLRCAVEPGHPNACSMLYGACARAAKAMGAVNLWTYIHDDEHGSSLRASGWWLDEGFVSKGGEWSRDGRERTTTEPGKKKRWYAPWSLVVLLAREPLKKAE